MGICKMTSCYQKVIEPPEGKYNYQDKPYLTPSLSSSDTSLSSIDTSYFDDDVYIITKDEDDRTSYSLRMPSKIEMPESECDMLEHSEHRYLSHLDMFRQFD